MQSPDAVDRVFLDHGKYSNRKIQTDRGRSGRWRIIGLFAYL